MEAIDLTLEFGSARSQASTRLQTFSSAERASSDRGHTEEIKALRTKQLHEIAELNESFQRKLIGKSLKDHIGDLKNEIRDSEASRLGQVSELQKRYNVDIGDMVAKNKTEVSVLKAEVEKLRSKLEVAERDKAENSARAENDCHELEIRLSERSNLEF
ncbi:hypothetical protein THAOC_03762 [Thalassiosira oceanica]|uniref:Uncharacterized protein n=1 Tax=Thalassiosira oceanica TaxID=159749 RepID=K0TPK6_THAOC|nr:hypothetical protein THAOC_03762 [Thalassiosira oceanica]|eukprot:EJK74552.1 hypothetical protein THAOC_03762 [Thalassiosira oceanica]